LNPITAAIADEQGDNSVQRLVADLFQLGWATLSPSSLNYQDVGLCARVPWADQMVDFDKVKDVAPLFYLNAYNVTDEVMDNFPKEEITLDHFKAAFAFPFIYGPYEMNGKDYYEGASHDCLNFQDLLARHPNLETLVIFDVLGHDSLIRRPRNLYDSWVLSMIIPLVKVAEGNLELFIATVNNGWRRADGAKTDVLQVAFDVPEVHLPDVLDWSHSNGQDLFEIGYQSALKFLKGDGKNLPRRK
jgi:predicted acylesterase/phospholipase RssA